MKKKILKTILSNLILVLLICLLQVNTYATTSGKIYFKAVNNTTAQPVAELKVSIYQIGIKNDEGKFVLSEGFQNCTLNFDNLTESNIENIKLFAKQNAKPVYTQTTDANGKFNLSNLNLGLYLCVQDSNTDQYTMQTMLVSVPELSSQNGLEYEVTVKPKIVNIEKKTENTATIPQKVTDEKLPYTGVLNWPIPILVILGIIIFCIGWLKFYTEPKKKLN